MLDRMAAHCAWGEKFGWISLPWQGLVELYRRDGTKFRAIEGDEARKVSPLLANAFWNEDYDAIDALIASYEIAS